MSTDPNTVASYNLNAEAYHAHVTDPADSIYHAYYEKPSIRAELPGLNGLSVISIGCGSGVDTQYLKDSGAERVVGIDISKGMIEIAKREHPGIEFSVMSMEKLEYPDESFDVAYSSLAIHYLEDWTTALQEAYRVLKLDGVYIFSCGHPLDQTFERTEDENFKIHSLGSTRNKNDSTYTIHGDYLAASGNGTQRLEGGIAAVDVVTYHQTFARMIDFIVAAGFTIEKFVEPQPREAMRDISSFNYDLLKKIPGFCIWVLRKK